MKRVIIVLLSVVFLGGCQAASKITLRTQPPGGILTILETQEKVPDGQIVSLEKGDYTITAAKEGYKGGVQRLAVDGKTDQVVSVPLGIGSSRISVATDPAGETVLIEGTGQRVTDGETIVLEPGKYTLILRKDGHRESSVLLQVDEVTDQSVTVARGKGYGHLSIVSKPKECQAQLPIIGKVKTPWGSELDAGKYSITVECEGYHPWKGDVEIIPGKKAMLEVNPVKIPTSRVVEVISIPEDGDIYFQDQKKGQGKISLGNLLFKTYEVRGEKVLNSFTRLVGNKKFTVPKENVQETLSVKLELNEEQRLYEGKWLSAKEVIAQEKARYEKQRISRPIILHIVLDDTAVEHFKTLNNLADNLNNIMRVGDRIVFKLDSKESEVWKRNAQVTPEFSAAIDAMLTNTEPEISWTDDPGAKDVSVQLSGSPLENIAFALHRNRSNLAIIDLADNYLSASGETIVRNLEDGDISLVLAGGGNVTLNGQALDLENSPLVYTISAGTSALTFNWGQKPHRLMLISDREVEFNVLGNEALLLEEKKIVRFTENLQIVSVTRMSPEPESEMVDRRELSRTDPMGNNVDLRVDEIGPNSISGMYKRVWLVRFGSGNDLSQRQLAIDYSVGKDLKDATTDKFLRRSKED